MQYRSIEEMNSLIRKKLYLIPEDIDVIVAVPRSGLLPAAIAALLLNKPLITIDQFLQGFDAAKNTFTTRMAFSDQAHYKKALVMDDSCNTGSSIMKVKEKLKSFPETEFVYSCVYVTSQSKEYVDIFFEICEQPRMFEWNILNHYLLEYACLDLDGVMCFDPTDEQNDDGPNYLEFVRNARPLFCPKHRVGAIVTSRLEKYREETEKWLEKNGIKYKELIMMDLPDMATRRKLMNHGKFKADFFSNSNYLFFIESNPSQAKEIFEISNKPVYCTGNNRYYDLNHSDGDEDTFRLYIKAKKIGSDVEARAYSILETLYQLRAFAYETDSSVINDDLKQIITTYPELIRSLISILESFSGKKESLDSLNTLLDEYNSVLSSGSEIEALNWIADSNVELCELVVDLSISDTIHLFSDKVTVSDWDKELNRNYQELRTRLIDSDNIIPGFEKETEFLKKHGKLCLYPYDFSLNYDEKSIEVFEDPDCGLKYVLHKGKRLYFPSRSDESIKHEYCQLVMEQDPESPHSYFDGEHKVSKDTVFIDVGGAEGIISLDVADDVSEIYLFECSEEWKEPLKHTFAPYKDKVHIINKYVGRVESENTITLDSLTNDINDCDVFIKMDIEGMEIDALKSGTEFLLNNRCKLSCTTYHTHDADQELSVFFDNLGFNHALSDGYMLFYFGYGVLKNGKYEHFKEPYFRKALIRAWN